MKRIVIFASGSGTNAEKIIEYFKGRNDISVAALFTDKPACGAALIAKNHDVPVMVFTPDELFKGTILKELKKTDPDLIVLAGFLRLLPGELIKNYQNRIVNIHPALLPKYGGKGFYGKHVHEAVLGAQDTETGITIHLVNEEYDKGEILLQKKCKVLSGDTPEILAERVRKLEHEYYPKTIENILKKGGER